jgi:hypothetical protein
MRGMTDEHAEIAKQIIRCFGDDDLCNIKVEAVVNILCNIMGWRLAAIEDGQQRLEWLRISRDITARVMQINLSHSTHPHLSLVSND